MPARADLEPEAGTDLGKAPAGLVGRAGKRERRIELARDPRGVHHGLDLASRCLERRLEKLLLERDLARAGGRDLLLELLELLGEEALGAHRGLLALVGRRHALQMRLR